jgi:hypothetical protein
MIKLNLNELYVTSYETDSGDGTVDPGDDTATTDDTTTDAYHTGHPRNCRTNEFYCITLKVGCESGGGAVC